MENHPHDGLASTVESPSEAGDLARMARVCVVIPAYNEEASIAQVVREVRAELPRSRVVVVDDGSSDGTAREATAAGATLVRLPVNLGIGGAVQTGFRYAQRHGFQVAMQVDGDGQHPPREAARLLEAVLDLGCDLAIGSRWLGRGLYTAPTSRRIGMRLLSRLVRWRTGQVFTDTTSGFRALGPAAISLFAQQYPTDFPEVESIVMATKAGLDVREVSVHMTERKHGASSIGGIRSTYYMARVSLVLLVGGLGRRGAK